MQYCIMFISKAILAALCDIIKFKLTHLRIWYGVWDDFILCFHSSCKLTCPQQDLSSDSSTFKTVDREP